MNNECFFFHLTKYEKKIKKKTFEKFAKNLTDEILSTSNFKYDVQISERSVQNCKISLKFETDA